MQESLYALEVWGKTFGRAYSKDYKEYVEEIRKKYREKKDKLKLKRVNLKNTPLIAPRSRLFRCPKVIGHD